MYIRQQPVCVSLLLALLVAFRVDAVSQDSVASHANSAPGGSIRRIVSLGLAGSAFSGLFVESYKTWWRDSHRSFSFYDDNWFGGHHGIDKAGHMFGGYAMFRMTRDFLEYGNHDRQTAFWWAVSASLLHSLGLEIGDGFSGYGFDYQDLIFDCIGLGFGMAQVWMPQLQNFNLKFSYWSARGSLVSPPRVTQDYDALTIWLTCNMHNVLPGQWGKYWPEFLQIAVGYGVDKNQTRSEIVFGIDFNLDVFSIGNPELDLVKRQLDLMHFPAPALESVEGSGFKAHLLHLR